MKSTSMCLVVVHKLGFSVDCVDKYPLLVSCDILFFVSQYFTLDACGERPIITILSGKITYT